MDPVKLTLGLALALAYSAIVWRVTRYAIRRNREIKYAQENGWRLVSMGNFITGPIYAPPNDDRPITKAWR